MRWLVLNKIDTWPEDERQSVCDEIVKQLQWDGPVFMVSAVTGSGARDLCFAINQYQKESNNQSDG